MKVIGWIVTFICLTALESCWSGFVLSILWGWFIAPIFHLAVLSIPLAIGLKLIVSFMTYSYQPQKQDEKKSTGERLLESSVFSFLYPLFALIAGSIIHLFVH